MRDINNEKAIEALKAASENGIQYALETASKLLGNPVVLFDLAYNLLAYTKNSVTDDPLWNELVSLGTFSHKTVDFFNSEKFIEAFAKSDCVALMTSSKLKYDRANVAIFNTGGIQVGNICIVACYRPFEDNDFELMKIISEFLSKQLKDSESSQRLSHVFQETFVSRLIDGGNTDTRNETAMAEIYSGLKQNIYIAVIDIIQYENTLTHLVYFRNLFSRINSDFKFFVYLNNIVAIMSTDSPFLSIQRELRELNSFFSEYNIYAGISDSLQDLGDLKKYFKQALNALNFGLNVSDGGNIFMYSDFKLEAFIKQYPDAVSKWRHPLACYIYDYDKKHKTAFAEILYAYLLHGKDTEKATKAINMEPKRFSKGLKDIERIFDISFENTNALFSLFAYMKLYKCFPDKFND